MKEYHSNCLIEVLKAKLKYRGQIKIIYIKPKYNDFYFPHWMWLDKKDGNVYDFHTNRILPNYWSLLLYKGFIRIQPKEVLDRWMSAV